MNGEMNKRDWNQKLQMWGKRGWNNLHGGWGLKRSVPSSWDDMPTADKRGWDSLTVININMFTIIIYISLSLYVL